MAQYRQHEQARPEVAKDTLRTVGIPRLKKWGVAEVNSEYSGYGDSGWINRMACLDAQDQPGAGEDSA